MGHDAGLQSLHRVLNRHNLIRHDVNIRPGAGPHDVLRLRFVDDRTKGLRELMEIWTGDIHRLAPGTAVGDGDDADAEVTPEMGVEMTFGSQICQLHGHGHGPWSWSEARL